MRRHNNKKVILNKQPGALNRKKDIVARGAIQRSSSSLSIYKVASQRPNDRLRILFIRSLGGIGDVLMTTPAVRQIREDFPNSIIHYAADRHSTKDDVYYQLLKNAPFIDEVIDARRMDKPSYNAWVDITSVCIRYENGNLPPLNRIDIFAKACGIPRLRNPVPFYKVEASERLEAQKRVAELKEQDKKLVFLHTASFDAKRCWPAYRYVELIEQAREYPGIHFLVSDFNNVLPDRKSYTNCLDVTNGAIRNVAATLEQSDLFVGPDSGPMHIAGALYKPGLALFGSIPPEARINYYTGMRAIEPDRYPCNSRGCFYKKCDFNTRCMTDISASKVLTSINEELEKLDA